MVLGDVNLVARIERLYEERYAAFCRLATGVTGRADTAHEAVQEGFAHALAHSGQFRGDGPLEGWLWRIVLRASLDARRRDSPAPLPVALADEKMALVRVAELPHPDRDPELDAALRALPSRQRLVVFLRYYADLTHAEIAAITAMKPGTVSATLSQAKATLARRLDYQARAADKEAQR